MEKMKRFISLYVPVTNCNLRCHYCYITHHRLFAGKLPELKYSPEHIRRALSKERLGGTCLINVCAGGETLLVPKVVDYVKVLLEEGHYVMVVTNATITKEFERMAAWDAVLLGKLFFKFSYHYIALKEYGFLDRFFANIQRMRDAGASFTLEVTPSDELIPYIEKMSKLAKQRVGANCHVTIGRDERVSGELPILTDMCEEKYYETWDQFDSDFFSYKKQIFGIKRNEFCYAGAWSAWIDLGSGEMKQCYSSFYSQNVLDDPSKPIRFFPIGNNCTQQHCYNGHAFLVLGVIPELPAPTYAQLRNRICSDGSEWLQPKMKAYLENKLYDANKEYSPIQKRFVNIEIAFRRSFQAPIRILEKVRTLISKKEIVK